MGPELSSQETGKDVLTGGPLSRVPRWAIGAQSHLGLLGGRTEQASVILLPHHPRKRKLAYESSNSQFRRLGEVPRDGRFPTRPPVLLESPQAEASVRTEDMSHVVRILPLTFRRSLSP